MNQPTTSPKPRLLIPVTVQFTVRYILRTGLLARLADYMQPVILLNWEDAGLQREFEALGAEVYPLPPVSYGKQYYRLKRQIDLWFLDVLNSPSRAIDARRNRIDTPLRQRVYADLREVYFRTNTLLVGGADGLKRQEAEKVWSDTNIQVFVDLIDFLKPDLILSLTPFFTPEQLLLRAAAAKHIQLVAAIASFDNLTTRGWIPVMFDHYLLWNRYNEAELKRAYPDAASRSITIVGAPQFDFYWRPEYMVAEEEWRKQLGLPVDRPVILFGGASKYIAMPETEIVLQIDQDIAQGKIAGQPIVLMRRHPNDAVERWQHVRAQARHVFWDEPWEVRSSLAHTNIRSGDIVRLAASLKYSSVHVNVSSTMTIDGAIFDRPQVGPAYDHNGRYSRIMRELYLREHYLPITNSGGLDVAYSHEELLKGINTGLQEPSLRAEGRKRLVEEIITVADGKATDRVAEAIKALLP